MKLARSLVVLSALALASPALAQDAPPPPAASPADEAYAKFKATLDDLKATKRRELLERAYLEASRFLDDHAGKASAEQLEQAAGFWFGVSFRKGETAGMKKRVEQLRALPNLPAPLTEMCKKVEEDLVRLEARKAAKENVKKGAVAPAWTAVDVKDGSEVTLESLRGKVVLLDFWATWCGPCKSLMAQELAPLQERYKDEAKFVLVSVGINSNDTAEKQKEFAEKSGYHWKKVFDAKGTIAPSYGVEGIPFLCLIDEEGKILEVGTGTIEEVKKALAEKLGPGKAPAPLPPG